MDSEELTFDGLQKAIETIRVSCDHTPINITGYLWECRCRKICEIRMPKEAMELLKRDTMLLHSKLKTGEISKIFGIKVYRT